MTSAVDKPMNETGMPPLSWSQVLPGAVGGDSAGPRPRWALCLLVRTSTRLGPNTSVFLPWLANFADHFAKEEVLEERNQDVKIRNYLSEVNVCTELNQLIFM